MPAAIQTGLIALHSNRSETLASTVCAWLRERPLNPLEEDIILVQSNGMAEWLKMTLASESGVCAATRVELPARFLWRTYRQVLGRAQVPTQSPMDKLALTWRLMQQLPTLLSLAGFEPIARFLHANEPVRLFQLASRLSDLLDQYQVYRADWLEEWAQGRDVLCTLGQGHLETPVPQDQLWQPMLWRALLAGLDEEQRSSIRPRLHQRVLETLQSGAPTQTPVARRVVLFGMTHLPLSVLQILAALADRSQVLLAIPNPCRYHWADIMDGRELLRMQRRRQPLRGGRDLAELPLEQMHAHAHPLLAAWGRQGRDFVRQLDAFDDAELARQRFAIPRVDLFDEDESLDAPLLVQVQHRMRDLVPLAEHPAVTPAASDQSIVFHIAHSALREVEILHDQLLALFAAAPVDQPLRPRDVVVMVPDIDAFAPAIRAVFGQYPHHDARYIPFEITDLRARASNPLLGALEWVLRLPQQRVVFSELRALLEVPAIAMRFGIDGNALPRLTAWMAGAGIRWGLDSVQRDAMELGACGEQNTGWFGLRRMLLGYAGGGALDLAWASIEPYPEVGGLEAELAGCLADFLGALRRWQQVASSPASPAEWSRRGRALLQDMVAAQDDVDRQTLSAMNDALGRWQDVCDQADFSAAIPLEVAREAWLDALEEPSLHKRFKAGGVTFCTLMPMRAIPFEVVCLLGMNDGDYPRRSQRGDFDLMGFAGQYRPGDRSGRDDDRQLMLEALLSARRVLYVSWVGRSVRDNSEQPPSVLVAQLRDYLAAGWQGSVLQDRTTEHPLQPFSRRYFEPDSGLFTHAREWRTAHIDPVVGAGPRACPEPEQRAGFTLAQLDTFLRNPVKAFFRQRLQVYFDATGVDDKDTEAFRLDGLDAYGLVRDTIQHVLTDLVDLEEVQAIQPLESLVVARIQEVRRAGQLPMGGIGERTQAELVHAIVPVLQAWQTQRIRHPRACGRKRLHFEHEGLVLEDWLDQLYQEDQEDGDTGDAAVPAWLAWDASNLCTNPDTGVVRADKLVSAWTRSVAAAASGIVVQGILVGRDATLTIAPMESARAQETLAMLLDVVRQGLGEPLPLALKTALALVGGKNPREVYDGTYQNDYRGEREEPSLYRLFPDYETLSADARFQELSHRVYGALQQWAQEHVQACAHTTDIEVRA